MKYRVAVGTKDSENVTEHFGRCSQFQIFEITQENDHTEYIEERITIGSKKCSNHQDENVMEKLKVLWDCHIILVKQIGAKSEKQLIHYGFIPLTFEGPIDKALANIKRFYKNQIFRKEV